MFSLRLKQATVLLALTCLLASACDSGGGPAADSPTSGTPGAGSAASGSAAAGEDPAVGQAAGSALVFYPPVKGAALTFRNSGGVTGTTKVTVTRSAGGGDGQTVTVTEVVSGDGTPVEIDRTFVTGPDGSLRISAGGFFGATRGFTVKATGDDILIPAIAELESGKRTTGNTFVELTALGDTVRNDVTYAVTGKGFAGVTVPAGEFRAYVVELALDVSSNLTGRVRGTAKYWFVPGFGLVRQETTVGGPAMVTELTASSVAVS